MSTNGSIICKSNIDMDVQNMKNVDNMHAKCEQSKPLIFISVVGDVIHFY